VEKNDLSDLTQEVEDSKVVRLVNAMIKQALDQGVSDIHIEPWEEQIRVRYRKDGVLGTVLNAPKHMHTALVSRIKIMSRMDIAERRAPQDGKFQMKYDGRTIDFRVSVLPTVDGEKVVMRLLDPSGLALDLDDLGFQPRSLDHFRSSINEPWGMVLVTGPTGSGKSTTLYSALQELQTPEENVTTVEDPVEYELDGIVQVPVNPDAGLTFADSLRSILRQDPDIVLVGEIRDLETADIAIKAALTGHMVMSTLHTNDAASAIARLADMGVDEVMVASSLNLVSAQRLLRELCDHCKEPKDEQPDPDYLKSIGFTDEEIDQDPVLYEANGCNRCMSGYDGRFAILETLFLDDRIRKMISNGATSHDLKEYAIEELDMMTLRRCGIVNALQGKTSLEEALRVTMSD
jgi:type IV pilus assembly protein PilB